VPALTLVDAADLDTHMQTEVLPDQAALALASASGLVRAYCGWNLLRENVTFVAEGDGSVILTLPTLYLLTVDEIRIADLVVNMANAPAPVLHRRGQLFWATAWPLGAVIEVDATHGYEETPDIVRLVVLTLAARILTDPTGARVASVGSVSRTYDTTLTALDMRLLDEYRI
jgi:hypothetical protein